MEVLAGVSQAQTYKHLTSREVVWNKVRYRKEYHTIHTNPILTKKIYIVFFFIKTICMLIIFLRFSDMKNPILRLLISLLVLNGLAAEAPETFEVPNSARRITKPTK